MVSAYDRSGIRAARHRIVLKALAATNLQDERDEEDGPRTLRSEEVARALADSMREGEGEENR
jgi:hypothetical protein